MTLIRAERLIAYGMQCDDITCEKIVPMANEASRPTGYYVKLSRVTGSNNEYKSNELFFHTKDCMLNALKWQASTLTHDIVRS